MKLLTILFALKQKTNSLFYDDGGKTLAEYKEELLVATGRQQFEKLKDLGLTIPVRLA